jgi:hypothetical protein
MTILEVRNANGVVGRCDSRCYDATHEDCDCICGGVNHSIGLKLAIECSRELTDEDILKGLGLGVPGNRKFVRRSGFQLDLFMVREVASADGKVR